MHLITTNIYPIWNQKLLLIKRSALDTNLPNYWEAPAGHVDVICPSGDSYCARLEALRELREETGLFAQTKDLIFMHEFSTPSHSCYILPLTTPTPPNIFLSHEHQNFMWVSLNARPPMPLRKEVLHFMENIR